jgi:hypothetical protein
MGNRPSSDRNGITKITSELVAEAINRTTNNCSGQANITQVIDVTCNPVISNDSIDVYEQNSACTQCMENVFGSMRRYHNAQRAMWSSDLSSANVLTNIDDDYSSLHDKLRACGINVCKACSFLNLTQANSLNTITSCYSDMNNKSIISSNLDSLIQQMFVNNQDVFQAVIDTLGGGKVNTLSQTVTSEIMSNVTQDFLNNTLARVQASQVMSFDIQGSISISNMSQKSTYNIILQEVSESDIVSRALQELQVDTMLKYLNEQTTLNSVGKFIYTSTLRPLQFIDTSFELASVLTLGIVLFTGIVLLAVMYYTNNKMKGKKEQRKKKIIKHARGVQFPKFPKFVYEGQVE